MYNIPMFNFLEKIFKKKQNDITLTLTINGETIHTENRDEITQLLKEFSEYLKKQNQST